MIVKKSIQSGFVFAAILSVFASACAHSPKKWSADDKARVDSIPVLNQLTPEQAKDYEVMGQIYCDGKDVFMAPTEDECNEEYRSKAYDAGADLVVKEKLDIRERVNHPKQRAKTYRKKADATKKYQL